MVQIRLTLTADGVIRTPKLITSSGSKAVDKSVMRAISSLGTKITAPKESLEFILDFNLY